ncbi:MAG: hypothetical protein LBU90_09615 [Bacteroidales bacterium]|jgi:hypothetical protein|nr:hypothetical protein [Bacteroidales bacterium]
MRKHLQQSAVLLFSMLLSISTFSQSWIVTNGNINLTPASARVGIGANANSDAKLTIHGATKYGIQLTNSGLSNGEPYPTITANGISITHPVSGFNSKAEGISITNNASGTNNSIIGLTINNTNTGSPGYATGIYCKNSVTVASPCIAYGFRSETTTTASTASVYGVHSMVSGINPTTTYSGYFSGGKFVIMNGSVGIGTETPNQKLHVVGNSYFNGKVGIGYANPTVPLDVNGTIRAHEVKLCLTQGCDYVFENNYNLMPLSELSAFVKINKHLPEVAPAAEMKNEGINVSEMNALLLKKIEELTLYIIDLEQRLSKVESN